MLGSRDFSSAVRAEANRGSFSAVTAEHPVQQRPTKPTKALFHLHSAALMAEEAREGVTDPQGLGNVVRPAKLYRMQLV